MGETATIHILLVEDNPGDARLVRETLWEYGSRFRISHTGTLQAARAWLAEQTCDVILLDLSLPDSQGFATITAIRETAPTLPVIVLTGYDDTDFAVSAVKAGTQDFLVKGQVDGPLMQRAIRYAIMRKHLEEKLHLSEARLKGIIELAHDAIVVIDGDQRITLFNPAAEKMFGYRPEEVIGRPVDLLLPERWRAEHARHVAEFGQGGEASRPMTQRSEVTGLRRDGSEFPLEVSISRFTHPGGVLFTAVARDITERKRAEDELRRLATTDPLTGVWNRRRFMELATQEAERVRRYRRGAAVLMMDVDYFKRINDTYGHAAGDEALRRLVDTCRGVLRGSDFMGRYGGEEFSIVLPEADRTAAAAVAERLRHSLAEVEILAADRPFHFTVSIGVTLYDEDDASIEQTLSRADEALYAAKAGGRNQVIFLDGPRPILPEPSSCQVA